MKEKRIKIAQELRDLFKKDDKIILLFFNKIDEDLECIRYRGYNFWIKIIDNKPIKKLF
jgi:hypothetical protein